VLINTIVQTLKKTGRVILEEGQGKTIELVSQDKWDPKRDHIGGIFLLFDLFQLKSLTLPFSEVSLDIIELSTKPVVFHSPVPETLINAPVTDRKIKFVLIREGFWNQLLFNFGRPLIYQEKAHKETGIKTDEKFPLLGGGIREMYLGPAGEVKIVKG